MLKQISSLIPIFSVIIIILGISSQLLYYSNFNLPIKYFIGLSELGLVVADDLLTIIPISIIYLGIVFFIQWVFFTVAYKFGARRINNLIKKLVASNDYNEITKERYQKYYDALIAKSNTFSFYPKDLKTNKVIFLMLIFGLLGTSMTSYLETENNYSKTFLIGNLLITTFLVPALLTNSFKTELFSTCNRIQGLMYIYVLTYFVLMFTGTEIKKLGKGKYNGTKIITADTTYISTLNNYFIGKTEKYVFIFNVKEKSTTIIPTESVSKMEIASKKL